MILCFVFFPVIGYVFYLFHWTQLRNTSCNNYYYKGPILCRPGVCQLLMFVERIYYLVRINHYHQLAYPSIQRHSILIVMVIKGLPNIHVNTQNAAQSVNLGMLNRQQGLDFKGFPLPRAPNILSRIATLNGIWIRPVYCRN